MTLRLIAVTGVLLLSAPRLRAEVIDRMMAVVERSIITQSDVRGAIAFGLVNTSAADDPVTAALDRLIERELVLAEVERYQPPEPPADQVAARIEVMKRRFPSAAAFATALQESGFTEARLVETARDDLRIERYLEQRFTATAQPTDEEVEAYFRAHLSDLAAGGREPALDQVRDQVRGLLAAERRAALVADWVAGLQKRADILRLYPPPKPAS
jgi:hypothetical protein